MEILDKVLGPVEVSLSFAGEKLQLVISISEKQLLDAGIKLLPVSIQPAAEVVAGVIEAGTEAL